MLDPLEVDLGAPPIEELHNNAQVRLRESDPEEINVVRPHLRSAPVDFAQKNNLDDANAERRANGGVLESTRSRSLDEDVPVTLHSTPTFNEKKPFDDYHLSPPLDPSFRSVSGYIENGETSEDIDSIMTRSMPSTNGSISASMNNVLYQDITDQPSSSSDANQIQVRVDAPEKILATMDTYVTYRICTKTRRSDFLEPEYEVRRRYSDFVWLRHRLEIEHPMCLLPPLPEKHSMYSLDRFDPVFIRVRCYLLHLFMQTVVNIPKVNRHSDLRAFLTAQLQDWVAHRKHEGSGQKVTDALYQFAATRLLSATDSEFNAYTDTCQELSQTAAAMEKMASKLHKAELQTCQELASLQTVAEHWSETESQARLRTAVSSVSSALVVNNSALDQVCDRFEADFTLPLKHWALYADAAKQVLRRRDSVQWEQCSARDSLRRKQTEKDTLSKSSVPNPKAEQKLSKLEQQLEELKHKSLKCDTDLRDTNVELRRQLLRWTAVKESDLLQRIKTMTQQRIQYHRRCLDGWERALASMDSPVGDLE